MPRWKMAAELSQDRHWRLILALYGDDKMPIKRFTTEFYEGVDDFDVATALIELANEINPGAA